MIAFCLVEVDRRIRGTYYVHYQGSNKGCNIRIWRRENLKSYK